MAASCNCIFKVRELRLQPLFSFDRNHIDLPVIDFMFGCVVISTGKHMFTLPRSDILFREEIPAGSQRFDFDKYRDFALLSDDVNLPIWGARVAGEDLIAALTQVRGSCLFAPLPNALVVLRHFRNSSSTAIKRSSKL